jgi:hypothetical protein
MQASLTSDVRYHKTASWSSGGSSEWAMVSVGSIHTRLEAADKPVLLATRAIARKKYEPSTRERRTPSFRRVARVYRYDPGTDELEVVPAEAWDRARGRTALHHVCGLQQQTKSCHSFIRRHSGAQLIDRSTRIGPHLGPTLPPGLLAATGPLPIQANSHAVPKARVRQVRSGRMLDRGRQLRHLYGFRIWHGDRSRDAQPIGEKYVRATHR